MRKRIGKWLRRLAERWDKPEPVSEEPKRTGLEKMLVLPSEAPVMRDSVVAPLVLDPRASASGLPGEFVPQVLPGDWGNGVWRKRGH